MVGSTVTAFENGMDKAVDFKRGLSYHKKGFVTHGATSSLKKRNMLTLKVFFLRYIISYA